MSKLIIHIGYPKTGTTSIQNGLFLDLRDKNKICYLGRSAETANAPEAFDNLFRNYLFLEKNRNAALPALDDKRINLLSDEEYTSPREYMKLKYGSETSPLRIAEKIHALTSRTPDLEVKIVIVIRRQAELIYSWYVQMYRFLAANPEENTLSRHVFKNDRLNSDFFAPYHFNRIADAYSQYFGKQNLHFLFFEDFRSRSPVYTQSWAEILETDLSGFEEVLFDSHLNRKKKSGKDSIAEFQSSSPLLQTAVRTLPRGTKDLLRSSGLTPLAFKLLKLVRPPKKQSQKVQFFTKEEEARIKDNFYQSNLDLMRSYRLDERKFYEYDYL